MSHRPDESSSDERIEREAAAWILREDRGLTAAEQDAFVEWLAADPGHGADIARQRRYWKRLDQLAQWRPEHGERPNPDLLAPPLRRRLLRFAPAIALAAAAAIAVAFVWFQPRSALEAPGSPALPSAASSPAPNQRVLDDGSVVELNRDATIVVQFTDTERRVTLERGEAHFEVKTDPARPFIVRAHGVDVRAVGTAFNVRVGAAAVEVLVTEGRVQLDTKREPASGTTETAAAPPSILVARQRAVVSFAEMTTPPEIATLTAGEIERVLAWQHRMIDFSGAPLTEIVAEFNRRNVVQLVLIDPELASLRMSVTLRSDNIDLFVRTLEMNFGARAERRGDTEILLRMAR
jgi:transmembrane sensor